MPPPDVVRVAEAYRRRTRSHAEATASTVLAAFDALGPDGCIPSAVTVLTAARLRAAGYAAAYVDLVALVRGQVTATDATVPDDADRLARAARTAGVLGEGSVGRLGRSEPLRAGQEALSQAMTANPAIDGWIRHTGGDACPLCVSLTGEVLPSTVAMSHPHPTCSCVQIPA